VLTATEVIEKVLKTGSCDVPLGYATQKEIEQKRAELQAAAVQQATPLEILTLPMGPFAGVGLRVRRFTAPLGTCAGHRCAPNVDPATPHVRYYDCQEWKQA
jgi:hypothetical protein